MDRRITIQSVTRTQNSFGEMIETWATWATVWAEVKRKAGRENTDSDAVRAESDVEFMIRYKSGLLPTMRIVFESNNYDISSIAEIGRRDGYRISANAFTG